MNGSTDESQAALARRKSCDAHPSRIRKIWIPIGIAIVALATLLPAGGLFFSEQLLNVSAQKEKGEIILVLGGDTVHRPTRALELFKNGAAPKVIISGAGDCIDVRTFLVGKGVPASSIELECNSRSTRENALFSIPLLKSLGARRVIIVTSWFHSRRALHCFRHYAPKIEFISMPTIEDLPKSRWPNKYERGWVLHEYVKILGYWICYGICPF